MNDESGNCNLVLEIGSNTTHSTTASLKVYPGLHGDNVLSNILRPAQSVLLANPDATRVFVA